MKARLLTIAILFFGLNSIAQERYEISLAEAQEIAITNNLTLKDQQYETEISRATVQETISIGLPQITGNINYTNNPLLQPAVLPGELNFVNPGTPFEATFGTTHTSRFGASLDQLLFDGTYLLGVQAAKDFVRLREEREKLTERDIRFDVADAYFGALISQRNIDIIDKNIENLTKLRFETNEIYEAGFTEKLDVDRLDLSLSNLKTSRTNFERLQDLNYNLLKVTMTLPVDAELVLTDDLNQIEAELDDLTILLDEGNPWPEYQVLEIQEKLENDNIKRYKKDYIPKVRAFGDIGRFGQSNEFGDVFYDGNAWSGYFNFGVNINVPIFDGNFKKAKIRSATATRDRVINQREMVNDLVESSIINGRLNYQNALTTLQNQKETIALAEHIYNITQIKYREGVGNSVELIQAEQELYTSQQNYISALYDVLRAKVQLEKALGK